MTKQFLLSLSLLFFLNVGAWAQKQKMADLLEDTETEENGMFTFRFFDAKTGAPVSGATVTIAGVGAFKSDSAGRVLFNRQEDGRYTFDFSCEGYVKARYEYEVIANTLFNNRVSVCPRTEIGALRIVLDWGSSPADLDLYLVKEGVYRISYRDKTVASDGSARLDRDDQDGYGPETITVSTTDKEAIYTCFVHDYTHKDSSEQGDLSKSKAVVRVYNNNELVNTFKVPEGRTGNIWQVFKITQGEIKNVDSLGN